MASPASLGDKISTVLTDIYKSELSKLDHPRASLISVFKVALSDEAFILYQPDGAAYRALTVEQSVCIRTLAASDQAAELETFARGLIKNALSLPIHTQGGFVLSDEHLARAVDGVDLNAFFKDTSIERLGKCFQVIKIKEGQKLTVIFQGFPEEVPATGKLMNFQKIAERINAVSELVKHTQVDMLPTPEGKTRVIFVPMKRTDDPLTLAVYPKLLNSLFSNANVTLEDLFAKCQKEEQKN
jgi:hypothetical protein